MKSPTPSPLTATSLSNMQQTNSEGDTANFLSIMNDTEAIERVRCTIKHAHVFKLPTRQAASIGWRGADWKDKLWQGNVKVVDRNDLTAVLLVEKNRDENGNNKDTIFAVCPIKEGAVERCVDSSRYFVLRIENQGGRHMFIGVAFNERNDAFDFNTALEDARREREYEMNTKNNNNNHNDEDRPAFGNFGDSNGMSNQRSQIKDYSLKAGEKIRVAIPNSKKNSTSIDMLQGGTAAFANFKLDSPESIDTAPEIRSKPRPKSSAKPAAKSSFFGGMLGGTSGNATGSGGFMLKPSTKDTPTRK